MLNVWNVLVFPIPGQVTPKELIDYLVASALGLVVYADRFFNLIDFIDVFKGLPYPPMAAEYALLDHGRNGHLIENPIDSAEERVVVIDVFLQL